MEGQEHQPLLDGHGVPCWPAKPDYSHLVDGERLETEGRDFESHWEDRKIRTKRLDVRKDFDLFVLGVVHGAITLVCREIVERDPRWQTMVDRVKTVATQACKIWLNQHLATLGWSSPLTTMTSFVQSFDS